jgi:hypothetical protein
MMLFLYTFLPRAILFLPAAGLLRWLSDVWSSGEDQLVSSEKKILALLLLVVLCIFAGSFSIFPGEVRQAMRNTNRMVLAGIQAPDVSSMPKPLKNVDGFKQEAQGSYSMEWNPNPDLLPADPNRVNRCDSG